MDEMLGEMTSREYVEWQEWYRMDPWGSQREDMRFAMLASVNCNLHAKGRHTLREFMLFPEREEAARQTIEEQRAVMAALASALSVNNNR